MRAPAVLLVVVTACGGGSKGDGPVAGGAGESCAVPFALEGANVDFIGNSNGFADDDGAALSSCGGSGAPDLVFTFTAPSGSHVALKVTATNAGFQPILKVRGAARGCMDLDDDCRSAAAGSSTVAELTDWSPRLSGRQYLVVDGQAQSSGPFALHIAVTP